MKVGPTKTTGPRPVVSTGAAREAGRAYAARSTADTTAPAPTADITSIAGIPGDELTPKVRDAIELLMHEVQRMRQELARAEKYRFGHAVGDLQRDIPVPAVVQRTDRLRGRHGDVIEVIPG